MRRRYHETPLGQQWEVLLPELQAPVLGHILVRLTVGIHVHPICGSWCLLCQAAKVAVLQLLHQRVRVVHRLPRHVVYFRHHQCVAVRCWGRLGGVFLVGVVVVTPRL